MNEFDKILKGKNCFITGATGGIGRNVAMKMAESGCRLFLTSTNSVKLEKLKAQLQHSYGKSLVVAYASGDLNNVGDVENIIQQAKLKFRKIDILINCAGVFPVKFLEDSQLEDFETCFNVNVRAPFIFAKAFAQGMKKNKWGRIVSIGSSSAYSGVQETAIYCASKHALLGLSRSLQDELKKYNIRTFCLSPSGAQTKMGMRIKNQDYSTFLDPQEIAEYLRFAISFNGKMISDELRLNRINIK